MYNDIAFMNYLVMYQKFVLTPDRQLAKLPHHNETIIS